MIASLKSILISSLLISSSVFSLPVKAAEKINFIFSPLQFTLSVQSLEIFAETGEITGDLKTYSSFFDENTLIEIRRFLSKSYDFEQLTLSKISRTSLGEDILRQLGKVISTHPERNGFYPIRGAILTAAGKNDSWTVIDILKAFPTEEIEVNLQSLAQLKDDLFFYQNHEK